MLGTLLRASTLTAIVALATIWFSTGPPNRAWWPPDPLVVVMLSVLLGVLVILKREGRKGIPMAAIFTVLASAVLVWLAFLIRFHKGQVEL